MSKRSKHLLLASLLTSACAAAASANAGDKFKVTGADCEMFWLNKRTPVLRYEIVDERKLDYRTNPPDDYFRQAAERTAEYCDRTSVKAQDPLGPARRIRGVWFQSSDGQFRALFDLDRGGVDVSAGITNQIGDRFAAEQRAAAQHQAQLDAVRTREARAQELKAAEQKAAQDKADAENARQTLFFGRKDLQVARLGAEVTLANFTSVQDVRTNPFHFRRLGLAVVRTQFNNMVSNEIALFGNELAPLFLHIEDVDRFTRSGETVMLAFKVIERGEVERTYGSVPELVISAMRVEPIFGDYVGAYTCPNDDCEHVFDVQPAS